MSTDTQWITRYLDDQADRVVVDDLLYEIEHGINPAFVTTEIDPRPRRLSIIVLAAATIAIVALGASVLARRPTSTNAVLRAAPNAPIPESTASSVTQATQTTVPPTTMPANQLPPGGLLLAGQSPVCTMVNTEVYNCTLPGPYNPAGDAIYPDLIVTYYTNSSSRVAGGCRTTSTDARKWVCFVGERAVAEGTITPDGVGALYLGQPALNEYAGG